MESYIHASATRVTASLISTLAFDIYTVHSSIIKYIEKIVNTTRHMQFLDLPVSPLSTPLQILMHSSDLSGCNKQLL
jgi:hypothetical protein